MRESSPMPVSRRPIAITTAKHYETSIPFLLWLFGTPLVVLVQFFFAAYKSKSRQSCGATMASL